MSGFEELVEELYRTAGLRLAHYGLLLTGSLGDAEDLVQDAVIKTFVTHRRLDGLAHAERYVRVAMRTLHIDRMRREQRWRSIAPRVVASEAVTDVYASVDESLGLAQAIAALPPRMRVAVTLRLADDMTVADVAAAMGIGVGTVKKYLSEARERMGAAEDMAVDNMHVTVSEGRSR